MRATDLLGKHVYTRDGRRVGAARDLILEKRPEPLHDSGVPAYHVTAIECGALGATHRLGNARSDIAGPWPLPAFLRWFARRSWIVRWDQIDTISEERITLAIDREQLQHVREQQP
jgi:hypothetical protein